MDPFEFSAQRSEAKSRSRFRRTTKHQVRAERQRELGQMVSKLEEANEVYKTARESALAQGASKKDAKQIGKNAAKAFMEA